MQPNQISATPRRVPKERLPDVMLVRFAEGTFARVDAVADKNRRSEFIREAVERELARRERAAKKDAEPKRD